MGEDIGFAGDPNNLLPVNKENYCKDKKFQGYSFTTSEGNQLPKYEVLTYGNMCEEVNNDTPLPIFSAIDFDKIPARCCASLMLQSYVASRI